MKPETKHKIMLALIWIGSAGLMGADSTKRDFLDWFLFCAQVGLLGGLAVALRHYYRQIKYNAIRDYRFHLMWAHYVKEHHMDNGRGDQDAIRE